MSNKKLVGLISAVFVLGSLPAQTTLAAQSGQTLVVNLSVDTGPVMHGATGGLYALTEPGTPSINTLIPLKPYMVVQKPTGGLQHPGADATVVAGEFKAAGGQKIFSYIQDDYSKFPYQQKGISEYLNHVASVVRTDMASPEADMYVFVPFNEPDWIWYNTGDKEQQFFKDWKTVYQKIRSIDPKAQIAGPNVAVYNANFFSDFLYFCKQHNCLPNVITWHELSPTFFEGWSTNYNSYRSIESGLNIKPIPISIDEYGNFRDLSVPGQLVQWIANFENYKVSGALAYWHAAGNFDDLVVQNNFGNGAWWLYKWYGDMTGDTVQVTPPNADVEGLHGLASLDKRNEQVHVLFGGSNGNTNVVVKGFGKAPYFGNKVHVRLWSTDWTGYEGISHGPTKEMDGTYSVVNGQIVVPVKNMKASAAYNMVITPWIGTGAVPREKEVPQPWSATYEAERAKLIDAKVFTGGTDSDANNNYNSGGKRVGMINNSDSRVTFTVRVPATGSYLMNIFYDNGWRDWALQRFKVDNGSWKVIQYPTDINWNFMNTKQVSLNLTKGTHTITFGAYPDPKGVAQYTVELDRIDLTFVSPRWNAKPNTNSTERYAAEDAQLSGDAIVLYGQNTDYPGYGYVGGYKDNGNASTNFVVDVPATGFYDVKLRYSTARQNGTSDHRTVNMSLNGTVVKSVYLPDTVSSNDWEYADQKVFLQAGINNISFSATDNSDGVQLEYIDVAPDRKDDVQIHTYEAEAKSNTLKGTARIVNDPYASDGKYVGSIGAGASNSLQFNNITVPKSGMYRMVVRYSDDEFAGTSDGSVNGYNLNVVDRAADVSVNGRDPKTIYFRNTFASNNYWTTVVDVKLEKGRNQIKFFNPHRNEFAPNIDNIEIASVFAND
ncbi:MAG: carbohydrate-binding protein [Alicyclobacillus sp.]|nr:carbohydrate-binding protein [Alicyclobacillus sp.]